MSERQIAITIGEGHIIYAQPRPEDQGDLAELFADSSVELNAPADDLEGHAFSGNDVLVDVEGHALTLHVPNSSDAAALRRALAVGAVTAALVGAGAIASLQSPAQTQVGGQQAVPRIVSQGVPAQAIHAEQAAAQREELFAQSQVHTAGEAGAAGAVTVTSVQAPPQAIHADQAAQAQENSQAGPAQVPGQARNFDKAQSER